MKLLKNAKILMAAVIMIALIAATACFAEGNPVFWGIDGQTLLLSKAEPVCEIKGEIDADAPFDPAVGRPWHDYNQMITDVTVDGSAGKVKIADCMDLFYDLKFLKNVDLSGLDTSETTSLWCFFDGCAALENVDLSMLDTANVANLQGMFYQCAALESLDLSSFDTQNVTTMYAMFAGCASLKSVDLSSFDTSKVENAADLFDGCENLTEVKAGSGWTLEAAPVIPN